jgi:hypothetical protein
MCQLILIEQPNDAKENNEKCIDSRTQMNQLYNIILSKGIMLQITSDLKIKLQHVKQGNESS